MTDRTGERSVVSVVIPTYYRNDRLRTALASVRNQSYDAVETIVVDDSGEGYARPVIEDNPDVRYIPLDRNQGANAARTIGAKRSRGEYVHFLDDDDRMYERKLERQVQVATDDTDADVVYTGIEKSDGVVNLPSESVRGDVLESALAFEMWPCMTSTMLIRRPVLEQCLPLSDRRAANDLELMIRLAREAAFEYVDEPLLYKHLDTESLGSSMAAVECRKEVIAEYADLYEQYPDRVRRTALANTYETEGALLLEQHGWSLRAVRALAKQFRVRPDQKPASLIKLIAASFGRPGWRAVSRINRLVVSAADR